MSWFINIVYVVVLYIILFVITLFVLGPFVLASVTIVRQHFYRQQRQKRNGTASTPTSQTGSVFESSALYMGRVWHTRLQPIRHAFTYPLFIFGLNLDEIYNNDDDDDDAADDDTNDACQFHNMLWPLSLIVSFHPTDHLKNGEGSYSVAQQQQQQQQQQEQERPYSLYERIINLIKERTNGSFVPTIQTHSVYLITHLSYYGYCFNPVSFYYIHDRRSSQLDCVIGEVSNTPWNEMYCYVLHPNSTDDVLCTRNRNNSIDEKNDETVVEIDINNNNDNHNKNHNNNGIPSMNNHSCRPETIKYIFPKRFHVSPFMEMSYNYEWTFTNFNLHPNKNQTNNNDNSSSSPQSPTDATTTTTSIHVINNLRPFVSSPLPEKPLTTSTMSIPVSPVSLTTKTVGLQFSAVMNVHRFSMHPYRIAYTICMYPMYCVIVQLWIHIQAFYLFSKGVNYQPHPNNTETTISRCIGTMMEPFFYIRDHVCNFIATKYKSSSSSTTTTTSPSTTVPVGKNKIS